MTNNSYVRRGGACIVGVLLLGLAACKSTATSSNATVVAQTVTVVGLNTDESLLLSDIYSAALQKSGFRVARRDPVADLAAGYAALNSGAADLFVTSTGQLLAYLAANVAAAASTSTTASPTTTAIATPVGSTTTQAASILPTTTQAPSILATTTTRAATTAGSTAGSTDATATTLDHSSTTTTISIAGHASAVSINLQTNQIGEILPSNLQIGAAANAEDKPVIVCSAAFANAGNLSTLTDLARVADGLQIAGTADFETGNPFGQPGLKAAYGTTFKAFVKVDDSQRGLHPTDDEGRRGPGGDAGHRPGQPESDDDEAARAAEAGHRRRRGSQPGCEQLPPVRRHRRRMSTARSVRFRRR